MFFAYLRLVRPINLIMILFTQYMVRLLFLLPVLNSFRFPLQLSNGVFFAFSMAFVFMAAGGYVINDYWDVKIDAINKPNKVVIGTIISKQHALRFYWVLSIIGILLGIWSSYKIGLPGLAVLFFIYLSGLYYYSVSFKYVFLIGNIIVALFLALVPFTAGLVELYADVKVASPNEGIDFTYLLYWVTGIGIFAFLTNLAREIIKDLEDIEGDAKMGCRTLPIVLGVGTSKRVVQFVLLVIFFLLCFVQFQQFKVKDWSSLLYFIVFIQLPLLFILWKTSAAETPKEFKFLGNALKLLMVLGISYFFVFLYNCLHP